MDKKTPFLMQKWGFMVIRPDEQDFQDDCNHENSKYRKHKRNLNS